MVVSMVSNHLFLYINGKAIQIQARKKSDIAVISVCPSVLPQVFKMLLYPSVLCQFYDAG